MLRINVPKTVNEKQFLFFYLFIYLFPLLYYFLFGLFIVHAVYFFSWFVADWTVY